MSAVNRRRMELKLLVNMPEGTNVTEVIDGFRKHMRDSEVDLRLSAAFAPVKHEATRWEIVWEVAYV